ncbi:MAG: hypothetical protein J6Y75_08725 [Spirochaetaceae bacterium]|nr:hypothetical protein [Spirochaetaceae bacterium]
MKKFLFLLLIVPFMLCACKVSDPKIGQARAVVLFDYETGGYPQVRMCAFVSLLSEYNRFKELVVKNKKEKLVWNITNPVFISDSRVVWCGSTSIYGGGGLGIPAGDYEVTYTDLADRTAKYYCKVEYPSELAGIGYGSLFSSEYLKNLDEYLVLFSDKKEIIYLGKKDESPFETNDAILEKYPSTAAKRRLFTKNNLTYAVLLPVETVKK